MNRSADALILGCGYLGGFLLRRLAGRVVAVTRSATRHPALRRHGADCVQLDLSAPRAADALVRSVGRCDGPAWLLVPPSGLPDTGVADALGEVCRGLQALGVRRAVLTSSTGVYGDLEGGIADADTDPVPGSLRERRLLEVERAWLSAAPGARVLRLGGLYGPGRVIGLETLANGKALPGAAHEWLNLLHAEDAAAALLAAAELDAAPRIGLVTDGTPVTRGAYYAHLARLAGVAGPVFGAGTRRGGSRRCDPASTWQALGLAPVYPDHVSGLDGIVGAHDGGTSTPE